MPGLHDGRQPLSQAVGGHRFEVAAEEAGVVDPRLPGQRLDTGSRGQRGPRLVERDVPVGADPEDLQIDAARCADRVLVRRTCCRDVGGQAIGALDCAGSEVDPGHEHVVDHVPVPLRMIGGQADVLVEGETRGPAETRSARRRSAPPVRRRSPSGDDPVARPRTAVGLRLSRAPIASAATPPISLASCRMTTSIYLFAVKRFAPEAISAPAVTASAGMTFPGSRSSMTTTGTMGLSPLASTDGTS